MKKAIADKWIKALNSNRYLQAQGRLCRNGYKNDSFCCLGVLTDLYIQDKHKNTKNGKHTCGWDTQTEFNKRIYAFEGETENLPDKVQRWAGMKSNFGELLHGKKRLNIQLGIDLDGDPIEYDSLIDLNDSGKSFKDIAQIIKKYWRYL